MIKKGWFEHWNDPYWKYIHAIKTLDQLDTGIVQDTHYEYKIAKQVYKEDLNLKVSDEFEHQNTKSKELKMIGPLPGITILKLS